MTVELPRLKPSPIPPINPVPEYLADDRLRAVYEDTKSVLQVPWMGVVTMAFAHYPKFYDVLWNGVREVAASSEFVTACKTLRSTAEKNAANLGTNNIAAELRALGYADRELDEIRDQIEVFSHGNMPYLLIATTARLLLEGSELSDQRQISPFDERHGPSAYGRPVLIEPHHADVPTQNVYEDIKQTLGLPFVNTDYRALARWPSYFALAWNDLRPHVGTESYRASLTSVHSTAINLTHTLPNPSVLNCRQISAAASEDGSIEEITEVVRLFQWLLPGLVLNVAYFRQQLN
ncbi:MAG: hypothetical protein JXQ99_03615 [Hyphomicrobiaceae bacterium]